MQLPQLLFPVDDLKIIEKGDILYIYDPIRYQYLKCTPEEYVRQALISHLINNLSYPKELLAVEKQIFVNKLSRRFDLVVFDRDIYPLILIEIKAPNVKINDKTLLQLAQYNYIINAKHWVLTNGLNVLFMTYDKENNKIDFKSQIPHGMN